MIAGLHVLPSAINGTSEGLVRFSFDKEFIGDLLYFSYNPEIKAGVFCAILDERRNLILELNFDSKRMLGLADYVRMEDQLNAELKFSDQLDPQGNFSLQAPILMAAERVTEIVLGLDSYQLRYDLTTSCYRSKNNCTFIVLARLVKPSWTPVSFSPLVKEVTWKSVESLNREGSYDEISSTILRELIKGKED
jgi:hypothetical protein